MSTMSENVAVLFLHQESNFRSQGKLFSFSFERLYTFLKNEAFDIFLSDTLGDYNVAIELIVRMTDEYICIAKAAFDDC